MVLRRKIFSRTWTVPVLVCALVLAGQLQVASSASTPTPTTTTTDPNDDASGTAGSTDTHAPTTTLSAGTTPAGKTNSPSTTATPQPTTPKQTTPTPSTTTKKPPTSTTPAATTTPTPPPTTPTTPAATTTPTPPPTTPTTPAATTPKATPKPSTTPTAAPPQITADNTATDSTTQAAVTTAPQTTKNAATTAPAATTASPATIAPTTKSTSGTATPAATTGPTTDSTSTTAPTTSAGGTSPRTTTGPVITSPSSPPAQTSAPSSSSGVTDSTNSTVKPTTTESSTNGATTTLAPKPSTDAGTATTPSGGATDSGTESSVAMTSAATTKAPSTTTTSTIAPTTTTAVGNCHPDPCVNGNCTTTETDYTCSCEPGFTGKNCSTDIDDCANNTACQNGGTCKDKINAYFCDCPPEWTGDFCQNDTDECATKQDNCSSDATCTNTPGGFTCKCKPGYTGDGFNCTDIDECAGNQNNCSSDATCTNTPGGYTCKCNHGYEGDGVTCSDIDECAGNQNNCSSDATCTNTPGGYTCKCNHGYEGDGVTCSDIDECATKQDNCSSDATCTNIPGSFTCKCKPGYAGNGVNCTDIDECAGNQNNCSSDATCTNTPGGYTCKCNHGYEGDGVTCSDIDECATKQDNCSSDATCTNIPGSFTCKCKPGYAGNGVNCTDVDECIDNTHECHARANCTNTVGSYNCTCQTGFKDLTGDGKSCADIDECRPGGEAKCDANNTLLCYNKVGSFECICRDGWKGDRCETDVNECLDDPCSPNATCTNTNGSFTCDCKNGYRGDGFTCTEIVLFSVPDGAESHTGDDNMFGPFQVPGGLPYQQALYYSCYVSMNGYITLGRSYSARYPPSSAAGWRTIGSPIIAPLWADIQIESPSALLINRDIKNTTYLADIVSKSTESLSNPRFGFMATWRKAVPYPYQQNKNYESADFQVAMVTNGSTTLLIFNYDQEVFTWDPKVVGGRVVNIGYTSDTLLNGKVLFNKDNFTQANSGSNIGRNGRWVFNVATSNTQSETEARCQDWLSNSEIQTKLLQARARAEICPCSYSQARRDRRFRYTAFRTIDGQHYYVYTSRFFRWPHYNKQTCHYSWRYWNLVSGFPGGGYLTAQPSSKLKIDEAYDDCCSSSTRLCRAFYQANPSNRCWGYRPPAWRPSGGDPHITTLDGKAYTFNGRGEYFLLKYQNTTVQARTELEGANGTELEGANHDATVFTGLAAQDLGGDRIEIALNKTAKTVKVFVNGTETATYPGATVVDITANKVEVTEVENTTDNSLAVVLESGVSIMVTVSDILDFVTSVADEPSGQASGLLGDFDGDDSNDFVLRNGSTLPADSTEQELFEFGSSWNLHNATESLFNYQEAGKDFAFYNNPDIKPSNYIGDITNITAYLIENCRGVSINESTINATCGGNKACIIDAAATCNTTFGARTRTTEDAVEADNVAIANEPPVFSNNDSVPLHVFHADSPVELTLNVSDSNDFDVKAVTNVANSTLANKKDFIWYFNDDNLADLTKSVSVKFVATDVLNASSEYWPSIFYCGCQEKSECDYTDLGVDSNPERFYRAKCNCSQGKTGDLCDEDVDVCDPFPCFEGLTCNSTNPESICGDCPTGYEGDGFRCEEVDECKDGTSGCDQDCDNTIGSYNCSCRDGYTLNSDKHTCDDINECTSGTDNCTAGEYCRNVPGSFECPCLPGYIKQPGGRCTKQQLTFVMKVFFEALPRDASQFPDAIRNWIRNDVFPGGIFGQIDIIVPQASTRKRREDGETLRNNTRNAVMHSSDPSQTTKKVEDAYTMYEDKHGAEKDTPDVGIRPITFYLPLSGPYNDADSPLCDLEFVPCDSVSTTCSVNNGRAVCTCKPGFEEWDIENQSCKDIDECKNASSVCQGGQCNNTVGSFTCTCPPGFRYDGSSRCQDLCQPSPCQNGGECIHGNLEGQYICKCDDKWAGVNCETENEETKRLKTIAIVVGAVIGGVCLLLLLALFGVWRRSMSRTNGYKQQSLVENDYNFDYLRTDNPARSMSEIPYKSDDNDAATSFSIPRPKLSRDERQTTDLDAHSNDGATGDDGQYSKINEDKSAQQPLKAEPSSSRQRLSGKENPSFLHDESTADLRRAKTPAKNRNSYEYF